MKIGMDSVLLGSWAEANRSAQILDIGSGCGILSFMLSQRYPSAIIYGIELFKPAYDDSILNLNQFSLTNKISFINDDFLSYNFDIQYDLIISNPPFFSEDIKSGDFGRIKARSENELPLELLINKVTSLLTSQGKFALIYDIKNYVRLKDLCMKNDLFLKRETIIKHQKSKPPKRILAEFHKIESIPKSNTIILKNFDGSLMEEYKDLTQDFYL